MMTHEQIEKLYEQRNQELKKQGFAAEFDGPVSEAIQEDLLSDFRKDLAKTLASKPSEGVSLGKPVQR